MLLKNRSTMERALNFSHNFEYFPLHLKHVATLPSEMQNANYS